MPQSQVPATGQDAPPCYTASQIAAALGISRQAAMKDLSGIAPAGAVIIRGNKADGWAFDQIPARHKEEIARAASRHGLSIADYLESSVRPWAPPIPFDRAAPRFQERAIKLHRAMTGTLARLSDPSVTKEELHRRGAEDYAAEFGYAINPDYWRKEKLDRVLKRAAWDNNFERLDIYLDENACDDEAPERRAGIRDEFRPLQGLITGILKRGAIGQDDKRQIWDDAFQVYEAAPDAKPELIEFLFSAAPLLAKNRASLRRNFDLLYKRWKDGGKVLSSIADERHGRPRAPMLTDEERIALIAYCSKYNRNHGWREAIKAGKLRQEIVDYYSKCARRMPRTIRQQITRNVDDVKMRMHGPRHAILKGPYINRNPDHPLGKVHAGDWDQADDMTFVNVVWDVQPDGSLYVGQPQLLLWIDERSWLPLGFVLICDKGYNAFHIRNSWTAKCDQHGLPRQGLYLEGSFWQTARVWVGKRDEVSWSETEQGIRRLGLRIRQAMLPRGKLIERVFGKLQNYLQAEPGYVGRNAITDKYEIVQKQLREVRAGAAHPREFGWLSKDEWRLRLGELLTIYSNEPAEGKWLNGLTPKQAYEAHFSTDLVHIPENCRYLLSCNKIEATIGANGLAFRYGSRLYRYKDERLGAMRFKDSKAIAWFNPENPKYCGVTDANGESPIVVKQETDMPQHDAPSELMSVARAENAAMERHAKEVYASVKHVFSTDFEQRRFRQIIPNGAAAAAVETQAEFSRQIQEMDSGERAKEQRIKRAQNAARKTGFKVSPTDPRFERKAEGAEILEGLGISLNPPENGGTDK